MKNSSSELTPPPPFPKTILPIFEHFPIVRFGWDFLNRFVLGCHLWHLHIFFQNSLPPPHSPKNPPFSKAIPSIFEHLSIVLFGWDFLHRMLFVTFEFFFFYSFTLLPWIPLSSFEHFPINQLRWNFLYRFILGYHLWHLDFFFNYPFLPISPSSPKVLLT